MPKGTPTRSRTSSPLREGAYSGWPMSRSFVASIRLFTTR